jgi:hypothetical protein
MQLDESDIDLHGWLRAFYGCPSLGRSFVMDYNVQRPIPSYANFRYGKSDYASILREILNPLGLKLVQGKWVDADSLSASLKSGVDSADAKFDTVKPVRLLRAMAAGILRSSARSLGLSYSELVLNASSDGVSQFWNISALASDSIGSLNFARVIFFRSPDTAHVVFGGEVCRPDATLNYENGTALTQYGSIFDGLTVDVKGDRWYFVWRREGSILEVPGSVGSCASGSSKVSFDSFVGVPFLSRIPGLRYLFSHVRKYDDDFFVRVCLEVIDG